MRRICEADSAALALNIALVSQLRIELDCQIPVLEGCLTRHRTQLCGDRYRHA